MKRILLLAALLLFSTAAFAQLGQISGSSVRMAPDCYLPFFFSSTGNNGTLAAPGATSAFDNRYTGCTTWTLSYQNTGYSVVSIEFDSAPDSNGAAGSFSTWSNLFSGTLPLTSTTFTSISGFSFAPWLEVKVNTATGTGQITGSLVGWRPQAGMDSTTATVLTRTSTQPFTCYARGVAAALTDFVQVVGSGGCGGVLGAGLKNYVTDITVASTTTTGGTFRLSYGTGAACASTNVALFPGNTSDTFFYPASNAVPLTMSFQTPLVSAAATRLCVFGTATNTLDISINGYVSQ